MKFYVISSFHNKTQVRDTYKKLSNIGLTQIYDWTDEEESLPIGKRGIKAEEEIEAAIAADIVLMLLPTRFGAHGELGAAIASAKTNPNKKIIVWAERNKDMYYDNGWYKSIFFYHPVVQTIVCPYDELFNKVETFV